MKRALLSFILCSCIVLPFPPSIFAVTKKNFDFVVGVNGDFKTALARAAQAAPSEKRFHIFFPNGEYNIGTLTGDENQMTTITTSKISLIGEDIDKTIIFNKAKNEAISTTATLYFNHANDLYLQDLTVLNRGNYGDPAAAQATGRFVALEDRGDKNIYKHVKLLSNQDTYYSLSTRTYWEEGEIHGFVDFICGYGDIFFNKCLLYLENRPSVVITAPSTQSTWGYVFMNCTIDGSAGDGYRLGRPWSNTPKCVFINTTMKKVPSSEGWGDPMNVVPTLFAEYNSKTASGGTVNVRDRRTTYTKDGTTVKINPVLSASQAATYTIPNVLKGDDNWQPDRHTVQMRAPAIHLDGTTLTWDDNPDALCWLVFKNGTYLTNITSNRYTITVSAGTKYSVRTANEMGGLGPVSNTVDGSATAVLSTSANAATSRTPITTYTTATKIFTIQASAAKVLAVTVFSINGKIVLANQPIFSANGTASVSLEELKTGMYLVALQSGGSTVHTRLHVQ